MTVGFWILSIEKLDVVNMVTTKRAMSDLLASV